MIEVSPNQFVEKGFGEGGCGVCKLPNRKGSKSKMETKVGGVLAEGNVSFWVIVLDNFCIDFEAGEGGLCIWNFKSQCSEIRNRGRVRIKMCVFGGINWEFVLVPFF